MRIRIFRVMLVLVGLINVLLLVAAIAYGQGAGFELRGPLTFSGYSAGEPVWVVGKGIRIHAVDPVLHKHLRELEGQDVLITVKKFADR